MRPTFAFLSTLFVIVLYSQGCSAATYNLIKDGKTCLIVQTNASLSIAYFDTTGHKLVANWSLGEATSISGQCESEVRGQASLNLTFADCWLQLKFANASGSVSLAAMDLSVNLHNGTRFLNPNATDLFLSSSPKLMLSSDTEYFACASPLRLPFTTGHLGGSELGLTATKIQAFGLINNSMSDKFATCSQDVTTVASTSTAAPTDTTSTSEPTETTSTAAPTGTTSTSAPPTTTAVAPTTAPPEPPMLNFTVYDAVTRVPCLRLKLRASLSITYAQKSGSNATVNVALPADTKKVGGSCGNSSQSIELTFLQGWRAGFTFTKMSTGGYGLQLLTLDYQLTPSLFPEAFQPNANCTSVGNKTYFSVSSGSSYYTCRANEGLKLDSFVTMNTRDLHAQAFRVNNGTDEFFGSAEQCQDDTPIDNVVPIVVGAALAGLVIIVLIAYLIGRRRHSSGGGYQSV